MKKSMCSVPVLLALTLALSAVSCANESPNSGNADSSADNAASEKNQVEEEAPLFAALPEKDYDGRTFRMFVRDNDRWVGDVYAETENGDLLNDAVFRRNLTVAEAFNISFSVTRSSSGDYECDAYNSLVAGDDLFDLIVPHARAATSNYGDENVLLDWNEDLPYVNLDNEWWNQDIRANLSIKNHLYEMTGDLSTGGIGSAMVLLFNKNLFNDNDLEYPYQAVLDGTWTYEKFRSLIKDSSRDLNGDGKIQIDDDFIGYVSYRWAGPITSFTGFGCRIYTKDKDDIPVLSFLSERTVQAFDTYIALIDSPDAYVGDEWSGDSGFLKSFTDGRSLFTDLALHDVTLLRDMDQEFGILPYPKLMESDEGYSCCVDGGTNLFCVPHTEKDPEFASIILEALAEAGNRYVIPTYYETVLKTKSSRDNESADMMDIIKNSRVFDIGYFDMGLGSAFNNMFQPFIDMKQGSVKRNITSYYETNLAKVMKDYDSVMSADAFAD